MVAAKLPAWHGSRISGHFLREARVAIRRMACADSDSLHGRGWHCMERGATHQGDGIPDQRREAEGGFVGSCYARIRDDACFFLILIAPVLQPLEKMFQLLRP